MLNIVAYRLDHSIFHRLSARVFEASDKSRAIWISTAKKLMHMLWQGVPIQATRGEKICDTPTNQIARLNKIGDVRIDECKMASPESKSRAFQLDEIFHQRVEFFFDGDNLWETFISFFDLLVELFPYSQIAMRSEDKKSKHISHGRSSGGVSTI